MRRAVTFSLVVLTVFLWAASLWRLSARVTGMDLVYADIFVFSGEIFERGLAIWRLDIFYQERFAYTLAFAGGIVHPILFIIAGVGLLCLPPPKDGFTMR